MGNTFSSIDSGMEYIFNCGDSTAINFVRCSLCFIGFTTGEN